MVFDESHMHPSFFAVSIVAIVFGMHVLGCSNAGGADAPAALEQSLHAAEPVPPPWKGPVMIASRDDIVFPKDLVGLLRDEPLSQIGSVYCGYREEDGHRCWYWNLYDLTIRGHAAQPVRSRLTEGLETMGFQQRKIADPKGAFDLMYERARHGVDSRVFF